MIEERAYAAHGAQPDVVGTADIPQKDLVGKLMNAKENPDAKPARLIGYLCNRAGLLLSRGKEVCTFVHRTFQEYLAACHLTRDKYPGNIAGLARKEPDRWREVALLAGAKAGMGTDYAVYAHWRKPSVIVCPTKPGVTMTRTSGVHTWHACCFGKPRISRIWAMPTV